MGRKRKSLPPKLSLSMSSEQQYVPAASEGYPPTPIWVKAS